MNDDAHAWLSAVEITREVSAGRLDPQAIVRAHLTAIDRHDPRIHAYVYVDHEARAPQGPQSGVTLAVKDSQPVAGMPWTYGTAAWRDRRADEDAVPVARARAAGMSVLGKTNLPELAASIGTTNTLFPATHNPWRQGISPGGSSGGSAAAVAAGMATVAMGEDMGGSIRIPASCCGVVGLRPSPDRVPCEMVDAAGLSSRGPLARTVADARLLFAVTSGTGPNQPRVARRYRIGLADSSPLAPTRLLGGMPPRGRRARRRRPPCGIDRVGSRAGRPGLRGGAPREHGELSSRPGTVRPGHPAVGGAGTRAVRDRLLPAFEKATMAANRMVNRPLQSGFDFLLTPTLGLVPMPIEKVPPFLGDEWARYIQFVLPVSFARVPAISIPAGCTTACPSGCSWWDSSARNTSCSTSRKSWRRCPASAFNAHQVWNENREVVG